LKSNKIIKREFLSAYQSGNGDIISIIKENGNYIPNIKPTYKVVNLDYLDDMLLYYDEMIKIYSEFNIKCYTIYDMTDGKYNIKLCFNNDLDNIINYINNIIYIYSDEKQNVSSLPIEYILYKKQYDNDKK
jgi:hypothetical protein